MHSPRRQGNCGKTAVFEAFSNLPRSRNVGVMAESASELYPKAEHARRSFGLYGRTCKVPKEDQRRCFMCPCSCFAQVAAMRKDGQIRPTCFAITGYSIRLGWKSVNICKVFVVPQQPDKPDSKECEEATEEEKNA